MQQTPLTLEIIRESAQRLRGRVRRTPLLRARPAVSPVPTDAELWLKLETLQATGSFKLRGALNLAISLNAAEKRHGLVTASGGNHGLGVAFAARAEGLPARVYLPESTPPAKRAALAALGAEVEVTDGVWDDAQTAALAFANTSGMCYVHPFADSRVVAGQGSVGLEILEDCPDIDTILVAIGGGGLIGGVAAAIKQQRPDIKIIGVEPIGAPTLSTCLRAGKLVTLDEITTRAGSLAPRRTDAYNLALVQRYADDILLVSDDDMRTAAAWLWQEYHLSVELSGAASIAALHKHKIPGKHIAAILCGSGEDGLPQAR